MRLEFEAFLYASVDEDKVDLPLSVLSALSRLDLDPWVEAARLAELPKASAAHRLAELIAKLPDASNAHRNCEALAARLVRLLPKRGDAYRSGVPAGRLWTKVRRFRMSCLFLLGLVIGWVWIFPVSCQSQNGVSSAPRGTSAPTAPANGINR